MIFSRAARLLPMKRRREREQQPLLTYHNIRASLRRMAPGSRDLSTARSDAEQQDAVSPRSTGPPRFQSRMERYRVISLHFAFYIGVLAYVFLAAFVVYAIESKERSKHVDSRPWSYHSAVQLVFEVITTIGYGNHAPKHSLGRVTIMLVALVGIPLWLMALADLGRYLAKSVLLLYKGLLKLCSYRPRWCCNPKQVTIGREITFKEDIGIAELEKGSIHSEADEDEEEEPDHVPIWITTVFLVAFITIGSYLTLNYSHTKASETYFDHVYYIFITMTTIGFGDLVPDPTRPVTLYFEFIYIVLGLTICTMFVDSFVDTFRQLHNYGVKAKDSHNVTIWIGRNKTTVGKFAKDLLTVAGVDEERQKRVLSNIDDIAEADREENKERQVIEELATQVAPLPPPVYTEVAWTQTEELVKPTAHQLTQTKPKPIAREASIGDDLSFALSAELDSQTEPPPPTTSGEAQTTPPPRLVDSISGEPLFPLTTIETQTSEKVGTRTVEAQTHEVVVKPVGRAKYLETTSSKRMKETQAHARVEAAKAERKAVNHHNSPAKKGNQNQPGPSTRR